MEDQRRRQLHLGVCRDGGERSGGQGAAGSLNLRQLLGNESFKAAAEALPSPRAPAPALELGTEAAALGSAGQGGNRRGSGPSGIPLPLQVLRGLRELLTLPAQSGRAAGPQLCLSPSRNSALSGSASVKPGECVGKGFSSCLWGR